MKKFSFNLKFLDRFKKSSKKTDATNPAVELDLIQKVSQSSLNDFIHEDGSQDQEQYGEELAEEFEFDQEELGLSEEDELPPTLIHNEEKPPAINHVLNELDSLDQDQPDSPISFDDSTDELPSFTNAHSEEHEFSDDTENEVHAESTLNSFDLEKFRQENAHLENDYSENDITNPNFEFNELVAQNKTEVKKEKTRFSFKMPAFGKKSETKTTGGFKLANLKNLLKSKSSSKDISWNDFITFLFSTDLRPKIHNLFIICLLIFVTYFTGKSAALFLSGTTSSTARVKSNSLSDIKPTNSSQDINKITSTNLFNIKNLENDQLISQPTKPKNLICLDAQKPTAEPLKLLDTIVLQDSVKSIASVQMRGQNDLINVREGEQINSAIEVAKITRLKVILKNLATGECEYISNFDPNEMAASNLKISPANQAKNIFSKSNPNIKNEGNSFKINTKYRDEMIGNMSEILTQAKAIQIKNPDGSLSFKMTDVVPGSIYSQLNIQNDDVITSINGKKIENLNELMGLLGKIKEIDHFQIGLKRNGVNENLEYNFE